jgi:SAM-dependent methyltransferase
METATERPHEADSLAECGGWISGVVRRMRGAPRGPALSGYDAAYAESVNQFIDNMRIKSVVELGCGDFRVGRAIAESGVRYTGVDRAASVVERNRHLHESRKVRFLVGDALRDELPDGELCLVGELFRRLANAEIRLMLLRLKKYRYVMFTDRRPPAGTFVRNLDKPSGRKADRLDRNSALDLRREPFNVDHVSIRLIRPADDPVYDAGERLCCFLMRGDRRADYLDPVYLD